MKGGGAGGSSTQKVGSRGDARGSMHRRRRPEADLTSTTPLRSLLSPLVPCLATSALFPRPPVCVPPLSGAGGMYNNSKQHQCVGVRTNEQQGGRGYFPPGLEGVLVCHPAEGQHVDTFSPFPRGVMYGAYP